MAFLRTIPIAEATGALRDAYTFMANRKMPAVYRTATGEAPGIVRAHSLDATLLRHVFGFSGSLATDETLSWPRRELLNAVTSRANECHY